MGHKYRFSQMSIRRTKRAPKKLEVSQARETPSINQLIHVGDEHLVSNRLGKDYTYVC